MTNPTQGFEQVNCPGCGGEGGETVYTGRDWIGQSDQPMCITCCATCGLCYTNPRPTPEALGRYYPQDYEPYQRQKGEIDRGVGLGAAVRSLILRDAYAAPTHQPRGLAKMAARLLRHVRSADTLGFAIAYEGNGRLLDFGCGNGTFLRRMRLLGWDVTGVDFSEQAVGAVRASGLTALQGTLPHPQLSPGSFDLITMRHALEHVPDAKAILLATRDLLTPGGKLHIQVPNFASWEVEHFGDASHVLQLPRHFVHFSPQSLEMILRDNGFVDVQVRQVCRPGWLRKSAKMIDRYSPSEDDRRLASSSAACRQRAKQIEREGKGNELIASARRAT